MPPALHFVGFRGDEYVRAIRVFGPPDFIHPRWDLRAQREIADDDTIVFASGDETRPPSPQNATDYLEDSLP